nr:bacteriocin [uncultured Pedobacter sp.]
MKKLNENQLSAINGGKVSGAQCFFHGALVVVQTVQMFGLNLLFSDPVRTECMNS